MASLTPVGVGECSGAGLGERRCCRPTVRLSGTGPARGKDHRGGWLPSFRGGASQVEGPWRVAGQPPPQLASSLATVDVVVTSYIRYGCYSVTVIGFLHI